MKKLFIKSSHGSLEYDHARMFVDLGWSVGGDFDIGCPQRPKIIGATDKNSNVNDYEIVVLHQIHIFDQAMHDLLKMNKRVVLIAFGQGNMEQHRTVSNLCRMYPHAYVAAYSCKDHRLYRESGCPEHKLEIIRFGKYKEDYKAWRGDWPVCYVSCNSIHKRGSGCGWQYLGKIARSVPVMLGGKETQEVDFGLGELHYSTLFNVYSHVQCFLSLGTVPAPMTMTLIDGFMAGTPTVMYNNGCGVTEEGFEGPIESTVDDVIDRVREILGNKSKQNELHEKSLKNANLFNAVGIKEKWQNLFNKVTA